MPTRRNGEYVPLHVRYDEDPAIVEASPLAELLYVRCLALAGRSRSNGYLTDEQVLNVAGRKLGNRRKVAALLEELLTLGPIERVEDGVQVRAWLKWNKSEEDLGRSRARDRDRKRPNRSTEGGVPPDPPPSNSSRNPSGIQAESERNPNGFPPRAGLHAGGRADPRTADGTALHDTDTAPTEPRRAAAEIIPLAAPMSAQTLVAEWIEHCPHRPPGRVVGQVAKLLGEMLGEGIPAATVRVGLAAWHQRGQHPATLPSFVNAAMTRSPARSTADQRFADGMALAAKFAELDSEEAR